MPATANRLSLFPQSAISEMTDLANRHAAVNLASGTPDFDPPPELLAAAEQALRRGYNQYAVTCGSPRLRQALAAKLARFMGMEIDPEAHLTITCGGTEAMLAALMAVCNPGDRLGVFSPYYENYTVGAAFTGAEPRFIPLHLLDFAFDPAELRRAFQAGIKALVLCNPSNPCGKVFTPEELGFILELAREYDAFVVADEVYEHLVYAPLRHTYIASLPGAFERVISCSSLSKTYAITGWRLGYVLASAAITQELRKVHDYLTLGAPAPLQEAAVTALGFPDTYYEELVAEYAHRRDIFLDYLDRAGLAYTRPQGAYYVLVDVSPFGFADDFEFCRWMISEIGVAAVPGSSFFAEPVNHLVRMHYAKRAQTLHAAGERLLRLKDHL